MHFVTPTNIESSAVQNVPSVVSVDTDLEHAALHGRLEETPAYDL